MKYFLTLLILLFLLISCAASKTEVTPPCEAELFTPFYNYDNAEVLSEIKNMPNLKEVNEKELKWYLDAGPVYEDIRKEFVVFVSSSDLYKYSNSIDIPLYILGYFQEGNIKQYLAAELTVDDNSKLIVINQVNNRITSSFQTHARQFSYGWGGDIFSAKKLKDNIFQINRTTFSHEVNRKGNNTCFYQIKITEEGRIVPLNEPTKNN